MPTDIWILCSRTGTDMHEPTVHQTEKEANNAADQIIKEVLLDAYYDYADDTDEFIRKKKDPSLDYLVQWAQKRGYGDSRYFWDGANDAVEIQITKATIS